MFKFKNVLVVFAVFGLLVGQMFSTSKQINGWNIVFQPIDMASTGSGFLVGFNKQGREVDRVLVTWHRTEEGIVIQPVRQPRGTYFHLEYQAQVKMPQPERMPDGTVFWPGFAVTLYGLGEIELIPAIVTELRTSPALPLQSLIGFVAIIPEERRKIKALLAFPRLPYRTYEGRPAGLDYLRTALERDGHTVEIVDVDVYGIERFKKKLHSFRPNIVGIMVLSIQTDEAARMSRLAKEIVPDALLIWGGPHPTYAAEDVLLLHPEVDVCVIGEGEDTIREIAAAVANNSFRQERESIIGLAFQESDQIIKTGHRIVVDLNEYPPTRGEHSDKYNFSIFGRRKTAQVMAQRGCPHACNYCCESIAFAHRHVRYRSLGSLEQEFRLLQKAGYEAIYFDDSTFTSNREWTLELCRLIQRFGFRWGCNTRVDALDEELIGIMKASGCNYLFCGVESAVPEILRGMNKCLDPQKYLEAAISSYRFLRKYDLPCSVFLVFGGPRCEKGKCTPETMEDVQTTLEFAIWKLNPDYLSMNVVRLLPGLPFSTVKRYACLRATDLAPITGRHWDSEWYRQSGTPDLRNTHPIYMAFEGGGSVNPVYMTPHRCYNILKLAVSMVNAKNRESRIQTKIYVDPPFEQAGYLQEYFKGNVRQYKLAPFEQMV